MRLVELFILSLTLPLYAIVLILFIELTVQRISANTTISGGGTRSRSQRRRQRMRSLIWTSNYLLVDFLSLLYELVYVIIHLTGDLALNSFAGRIYCQFQVYVPLYLTALMAYSLTAISIYRRRHFVNLNSATTRSNRQSFLLILALWIMPIITSILPAYLLTYLNVLRIAQHESTNECQISYTYGSTVVAIYMFYRLGENNLLLRSRQKCRIRTFFSSSRKYFSSSIVDIFRLLSDDLCWSHSNATSIYSSIQTSCTYSQKSHSSNSLSLSQFRGVLVTCGNHHPVHEKSSVKRHRSGDEIVEHSSRSADHHRFRHALLFCSSTTIVKMASRRIHVFSQSESNARFLVRLDPNDEHTNGNNDQTAETIDASTVDRSAECQRE